jgi:hypothetical protein
MGTRKSRKDALKQFVLGALLIGAAGFAFPILNRIKLGKEQLEAGVPIAGILVLTGLTLLYLGVRDWRTPDRIPEAADAPERWSETEGPVFDATGMQFRVTPHPGSGYFTVWLEFLNRYQGAARLTICLTAHGGIKREVIVECPGGAHGLSRFSVAIPKKYQEGVVFFQLAAWSAYPAGKGTWLRPRTANVLKPPPRIWENVGIVLMQMVSPVPIPNDRDLPTLAWMVPPGVSDVVHERDVQTEIVIATDA